MERRESGRLRGTTRELDDAARELRRNMTPAETTLWERLRGRQVAGWKFRAQHAIGRFILDFCCARARLVVEVDGESHRGRVSRDRERDQILRSAGYTVLRYTNDDVAYDLDAVVEDIRAALAERATPARE